MRALRATNAALATRRQVIGLTNGEQRREQPDIRIAGIRVAGGVTAVELLGGHAIRRRTSRSEVAVLVGAHLEQRPPALGLIALHGNSPGSRTTPAATGAGKIWLKPRDLGSEKAYIRLRPEKPALLTFPWVE